MTQMTIEHSDATKKKLPAGWSVLPLGDVIQEAQAGFASGERASDGIIQVRMNNVDTRGNLIWSEFLRVPADQATIEKFRLRSDDVLFNNTNSTDLVGKSTIFKGHPEPIVYSNHFTRLRVKKDRLDPDYLRWWLLSQWQSKIFSGICNRWIGQSAVKSDKLLSLPIPISPLPEQKQIAAILTEQMAVVEKARAATEVQLEAVASFPKRQLARLFAGAVSAAWPKRKLHEMCDLLPAKSISTDGDTEVFALTTACLTETGFDPTGVKVARMWRADAAQCRVRKNEILVARSNTPDLVGRVAVYRGSPSDVVASDLTIRICPHDGLLPDFLAAHLSTLFLTGYWKEHAGGASGTMKKITRTQLLAIDIPVPLIEEQQKLVAESQAILNGAKNAKQRLGEQLRAVDDLPAALLRRAFMAQA